MTTCPKCGYARQAADAPPDYECPRCGVIYAKYVPPSERPAATAVTSGQPRAGKPLLIAVGVMVVAVGGWQILEATKAEREFRAQQVVEAVAKDSARQQEESALAARKKAVERQGEIDKAVAEIRTQHRKWMDASRLAGSTSRISLSGPVAALQSSLRETEAVVVPPCLDRAKALLLLGMQAEIEAFVLFMRNRSDRAEELSAELLSTARSAYDAFDAAKGNCDAHEAQ